MPDDTGKIHVANPAHEVAYQELIALLNKHADHLSAMEMLAVAANLVGKLIAMQDQRTVSTDQAFKTVTRNIEMGNRSVFEQLAKSQGRA